VILKSLFYLSLYGLNSLDQKIAKELGAFMTQKLSMFDWMLIDNGSCRALH